MGVRGVLIAFCGLLPALAGAKSPVTHEAIWLMKRVGGPVPSPDGKLVVFSVTEPAYDEKNQVSDLWIVPADGSTKPRRLTSTKGGEGGVAWSPDSRKIAFTAKRDTDEANQVYVLNIAEGGEAVRTTSLSTGVSSPQWSPQGNKLLFTSEVYPDAADDEANKKIAAERKARKYKARVYETFPIRFWDHWLDDRQVHILVQEAEPGAKARDLLAGTQLARQRGFGGSFGSSAQEMSAAWAPDGGSVVFAATTTRDRTAFANVNTHLYQVPLTGGEPKRLTQGEDSYSDPVFAPDGRWLYCSNSREDDKVYHLNRIARYSWPSPGEKTVVTAKLDRSVSSFRLSPDSTTIYLLAEEHGHDKIFYGPAQGGEFQLVLDVPMGVYSSLAVPRNAPASLLFATWESAVNPAEVVRIDPAEKRHRPLTEFNSAAAAELDWLPVEHFWFTSKAGKQIHNILVRPPGFDQSKKYPLFVFMHGGAHNMSKDQFFLRWNYHLLTQPGFVMIMTNYTGSTGFGEKFSQQIQFDPLRGPAEEINQGADEAIKRYSFIDGSRQAAGGASYGGHLANWMQATTTRYKCLISHAGLINLESQWGTSDSIYHREVNAGGPVWEQGKVWREQNPIRHAARFRTPILLTVGENDFRVPINQTIENWSVLQRLRIPSKLIVFPEANHWIQKGEDSRFFYQEVTGWLKDHLR